eukprot:sb/3476598/
MKILTKFKFDWMRLESAMARKPISSYLILNSHNTLDNPSSGCKLSSKNFGNSLKNDNFKTFCRTFLSMKKDPTSTNAHTSSRSTSCENEKFLFSFGVNMVYKKRLSYAFCNFGPR